MTKLPISAVVVSCDEGYLLPTCLTSIVFCKEIIVVGLESTDNTTEIALQHSAKVVHHSKVPVVEHIRKWIIDKVSFDWVLFVDPDEVYNAPLQEAIIKEFHSLPPEAGCIELPIQFLFRSVQLKGGVWGGQQFRGALRHRSRNRFSHHVHEDISLQPGFLPHRIIHKGAFIEHFWMQSYTQLFEKHRRYLKEEGRKMFEKGKRYSPFQHLYHGLNAFRHSFFLKKGYKDGLTGLFLSFFWCWYISGCWFSLWQYERRRK